MSILKTAHPWRLVVLGGLLLVMVALAAALMAGPAAADKPVDGKHSHGGGEDKSATVEMSDGMVTDPDPTTGEARPQEVVVVRDNKNFLQVQEGWDGSPTFTVAMNLINTANAGNCTGDTNLLAKLKLEDGQRNRSLVLAVDLNSLDSESAKHKIRLHWHTELQPELDLIINSPSVSQPSEGVFEFSGGTVKVRNLLGSGESTEMVCPLHADDAITVTVVF